MNNVLSAISALYDSYNECGDHQSITTCIGDVLEAIGRAELCADTITDEKLNDVMWNNFKMFYEE